MADNTDYTDILDRSFADLPEELLLPDGKWRLKGKNATNKPSAEEGKNGYVLFFYQAKAPVEVNDDSMAALGDYDYTQNDISHQIWIDKPSAWRSKVMPFLTKHGIDTTSLSLRDALKAFKGTEIDGYVEERNYTDKAGQLARQNTISSFEALQ